MAPTFARPFLRTGELNGWRAGVGEAPGRAGDAGVPELAGAGAPEVAGNRSSRTLVGRQGAGDAGGAETSVYRRAGHSALQGHAGAGVRRRPRGHITWAAVRSRSARVPGRTGGAGAAGRRGGGAHERWQGGGASGRRDAGAVVGWRGGGAAGTHSYRRGGSGQDSRLLLCTPNTFCLLFCYRSELMWVV